MVVNRVEIGEDCCIFGIDRFWRGSGGRFLVTVTKASAGFGIPGRRVSTRATMKREKGINRRGELKTKDIIFPPSPCGID